ncbi:hypothetical protein AOQ84DRAFT_361216 [Glonium stellatum]|uniref:Uncharacterized protein n=1 Tax=Glonium stellatum TaxID=574774 RepID=A0A8E2JWH7_9PEZI|nr:hypothetical protein AOQ84DRAFT_361216 [Glonium stellatum]
MDPDTLMPDSDAEVASNTRHFVVAVDFGTTFSSVAYVGYTHPNQRFRIGFRQVEIVDRYPDHPYGNFTCHDVPTEIWYSQRIAAPLHSDGSAVENELPADDTSSEDDDDNESETEISSEGASEPDVLLNTLGETCKTLKKMRLIEEDIDIIADYLEQLFRHTKKRLIESEGYTDASPVEFVLCIPAIWKAKAARQMQVAMGTAITKSGLGKLQNGSIDNLFLVSEPEAAAACLLASEKTRLETDDTFILLDAGGGTVDAITYTVDKDIPLRLRTEEVVPGGAMCGSSFINERLEDLLISKLKAHAYLEKNGETLSKIINGLVVDFERQGKKKMDLILQDHTAHFTIKIPGLLENKKKRFRDGKMYLTRKEAKKLFKPSLEGVARVMMDQLRMAQQKGRKVKKIILIGGFGQSESLSAYLRDTLEKECGLEDKNIVLESSKIQ